MQFLHRALGFFDRLHLNKSKAFRALIVTVADYFSVLDVTDPVKQVEQIAFGRVERQIADIETGRSNFDRLRFTLWPRLPRLSLLLLGLGSAVA